jgi:hypothetical protein
MPVADTGLTINQASAAGAYARSELLGAAIPVRPTDPVRPRFQVADQPATDQAEAEAKAQSTTTDPDQQSAASKSGGNDGRTFGNGFGLLGAFTSFFARFFGQSESDTSTAATPPAIRSGIEAYGHAADIAGNDNPAFEVLSPLFPSLASGHRVDLTV